MSPTRKRRANSAGKGKDGAPAKPRKPASAAERARKNNAASSKRRGGRSRAAADPLPADPVLRRHAERLLRDRGQPSRSASHDTRKLLHELEVHQVELEIQNEELRRAQVELAAARDLFADLYEFAPIGYVTLDGAGKVQTANLMAAALLGIERRRLVDQKLATFIASEARQDWSRYLSQVAREQERVTIELPFRWAGRDAFVRFESTPASNGEGFRCALLDVTDRRRAQQELEAVNRELERRVAERTERLEESNRELREQGGVLRTILESAAEGIITTDARGRIETVNPAAERIFGYGSGEMVGLDIGTLMAAVKREGDRAAGRRPVEPALQAGRWRDLRGRRKQGGACFVDVSVSEYEERERKFTAIIRDVGERRRLQREIAQRVTEEQQAIGSTLHDGIAQHLAAAEMMIGVLKRRLEKAAAPGLEMAEDLLRVVRDAQQQVRAVMRGVLPYTVQAAGLDAALRELASTVGQRHGIDCVFERRGAVDVEDPHTGTQLYYIASEAIHNAARHARASRAVIELEAGTDAITLTVTDDGVGIPADSKPGAGTGIIRYRANLIDADLTVRPGPSGGTVVSCSLTSPSGAAAGRRNAHR